MEGRKRILHVGIDSYLGGIETYLKKITTYIDRNEFEFNFLAFYGYEPCFYNELKELGGNFFFITKRSDNYLKYISELKQLFKQEKFDIVHCHLNSLSNIAPCLIALKAGIKVIIHSRNAGSAIRFYSAILNKINYYRLPMNKLCCVAVSDLAGRWMFGKNVQFLVLNNGLDTDIYRFSQEKRVKIRTEFGLSDEIEIILHVGTFRKQKNHTFLIDIFYEYHKSKKNSVLLLLGDGELRESVKELVNRYGLEKNVLFLGNRKDVAEVLSAADKFLFPSFYEGFPNALIEAETSGLMCVASDVITNQAMIEGICHAVSLEAPISEWVNALSQQPIPNRIDCAAIIDAAGFGISEEIERLSSLYRNCINEG